MDKQTLISKKDLEISWFSGSNGGQHANRHKNFCRMHHPASGVTVQATEERSAEQNLRTAFVRLAAHPRVKLWIANILREIRDGQTREERIKEQMHPRYLKIEVLQNGQWVEEPKEKPSE